MGQYLASNFTFFFCLTWLFPHLRVKYNLDALEAGFFASAPLIFGALGNWFSGFLVDFIFKKKKWGLSRKIPAIIGFLLASVGIVASVYMEEVTPAIIFISIAVFGADMTLSPSWMEYDRVTVSPKETYKHRFPEAFQARWIRFRVDKNTKATAYLNYK